MFLAQPSLLPSAPEFFSFFKGELLPALTAALLFIWGEFFEFFMPLAQFLSLLRGHVPKTLKAFLCGLALFRAHLGPALGAAN
jgi:hypothetical protein